MVLAYNASIDSSFGGEKKTIFVKTNQKGGLKRFLMIKYIIRKNDFEEVSFNC